MEILTAFIAQQSVIRSHVGAPLRSEPEADISAALKVITRRNRASDVDRLVVRKAHLKGVILSGSFLGGMDFIEFTNNAFATRTIWSP